MALDDCESRRADLTITFGNVTLDMLRGTLSCGSRAQDVSTTEADLFHLLVRRAPEPVTFSERVALRGHQEANESDPYRKTVEHLAAKLSLVSDGVDLAFVGDREYVLKVADSRTRRAAAKRPNSQRGRRGRAR